MRLHVLDGFLVVGVLFETNDASEEVTWRVDDLRLFELIAVDVFVTVELHFIPKSES